jgi:uncharacterized protein (DUF1810 family)
VDAQAAIYPRVVEELLRGRKETHWMWFILPQIASLGFSSMAQRFARLARGGRGLARAWLARARLVMTASEKTRNRYPWLSRRHEVPVNDVFAEAIAVF